MISSRKITDIYEEYNIMPNLAEHMLRVAAVASLICDNLNEPLSEEDRRTILTVCLLHDMANIVKSDFNTFPPDFYGSKDLNYWQDVKDEFIKKYGNEEHGANKRILEEIGIDKYLIGLADEDRFSFACKIADGNDFNAKIIKYSDFRAGPYGVLSYDERIEEAEKRYKKHRDFLEKTNRNKLVECGRELERQIFAKCGIRPEDINDKTATPVIAALRNFVIQ